MATKEVEVFILVDENGDHAAHQSEEAVFDAYDESIGGNSCRRLIKLTLTVPLPEPLVVRGTVPAPAEPEVTLEIEAA